MNPERAPSVSVILPTYERRESTRRAAKSVLEQTFRDFELIVVDDGSRDGTREAVTSLSDSIRYLWQPNRGVSAARNAGLACARGEIVAFLDSDDRWLQGHLAVIVALLRRFPAAVLACTSPEYRRHGQQRPERARLVAPFPAILTRSVAGFPSSSAVRRAELEAIGGFDERFEAAEDTDLWLRLAIRGPFALVRRRTAVIARTEGSLSVLDRPDRLKLYALSLARVEAELGAAGNCHDATKVRGALCYIEALLLLGCGSERVVAERLALACRGLPELSEHWGLALFFFNLLPAARDPLTRSRDLRTLVQAWPDRRATMVAALLTLQAITSLQLRRPQACLRALRSAPRRKLIRLGVRAVVRPGALAAVTRVWRS